MRSFRSLFAVEVRLFLREPFAVFFTLLFPLLLLLILGSAFANQGDYPGYKGFDGIEVFVPQLVVQIAGYLGVMGIPIAFAEYREMGVFERMRATPVRLGAFLTAHVLSQVAMLLAGVALLLIAAAAAFHLFIGGGLEVVAVVGAGATCMFAIGLAIAALTPSARTAQAAGAGIFFPMLFLSGIALPREGLPQILLTVGDALPLTRVADAVTHSWLGQPFDAYQWASLAIMAGYTAAAVAVARLAFRWS